MTDEDTITINVTPGELPRSLVTVRMVGGIAFVSAVLVVAVVAIMAIL